MESNNNGGYQLLKKPIMPIGSNTRKRSTSLPAKSKEQALLGVRMRSNSLPNASTYLGDFAIILKVVEEAIRQDPELFSKAEIEHIQKTLEALNTLDRNAEKIAAAKKPRDYAMKLTNIGIEDGFNKGESAEHIRGNARMILANFPTGAQDQIDYIKATLNRADPCLTARMEKIQDYVAFKQVGEIEIEGQVDIDLARSLYLEWGEYEGEHEMEHQTLHGERYLIAMWAAFIAQIDAQIKADPNYLQSLAWAKDAAQIR